MRQSNASTLSEPKKYMDTLIQQHRAKNNAEYMQTETSTGEFRMVARATRRIQMGEEIFANYNNIGDETNAFSMPNCMCCSCRDKSKNP
jgi:hypothetical protein